VSWNGLPCRPIRVRRGSSDVEGAQKGLIDPGLRRQVIVTTNDATLPVMADAELVIPLEVREDHPRVIGRASIDDRSLRDMIEATLDNGQEVFKQYGL